MSDKKKDEKLQLIITDLQSKDEKKVAKAIKTIESKGSALVIKPLANVLLSGTSEKNKSAIIELLSSLKDTSTIVEIMDVLDDTKYLPIRQTLLSTVWNTKVDFSGYIDSFVEIATKGDFMEAVECLTIIENLEGPFEELDILECQLHLKNYLESNVPKDDQKAFILSEIAIKIKEINESLMD